MSVTGLKKQFHKADQLLKEKINVVERTQLDEDFLQLEKKTDITHKMIVELVPKTIGYLQPNPASRAKLIMASKVSKIRGQKKKSAGYRQTEGILGDCMLRYGNKLGGESGFGFALLEMGDALKKVAKARDCMDMRVKKTFIDPLQSLQHNELKEIEYLLKKLEGRRLDFDYKKRHKGKIADTEITNALQKFEESKHLAETSMCNLFQKDAECLKHLSGLLDAAMDYHRKSYQILENLKDTLQSRISDIPCHHPRDCAPKTTESTEIYGVTNHSPERTSDDYTALWDQPCCKALYNFQPESQRELGFRKGDIIVLTNQIDENWYEGTLRGMCGFIPKNYVVVLAPLPQRQQEYFSAGS